MKCFIENGVSIDVNENHNVPGKGKPFFNPKMRICRELVLSTVGAFRETQSTPFTCLDAFGATGLAGLQWKKKFGDLSHVTITDRDEICVESIQRNCVTNGITTKSFPLEFTRLPGLPLQPQNETEIFVKQCDANVMLHMEAFDFIHLDPFGCTVKFLLAAFTNVRNNGIICLVATDIASLLAKHCNVAKRNYGAKITRTEYGPELAARVLTATAVRAAVQCNKGVEVLYTVNREHFLIVCVRVRRGAKLADDCMTDISNLLHCQICGERAVYTNHTYPIEDPYHLLPCRCKDSSPGTTALILGPLWRGDLFNSDFLKLMYKVSISVKLSKSVTNLLPVLIQEAVCPNSKTQHLELCKELQAVGHPGETTHEDSMRKVDNSVDSTHICVGEGGNKLKSLGCPREESEEPNDNIGMPPNQTDTEKLNRTCLRDEISHELNTSNKYSQQKQGTPIELKCVNLNKQTMCNSETETALVTSISNKRPLSDDGQTDCGKQPRREDVTLAHLTQIDCGKQPRREDVTLAHLTQIDCGKQPRREDVTLAHLTQTDCGKQPLREDVTMAHFTQTDCGKQPLREDVTMAHFTQTDCGKQPLREDVTMAHFTQTDCGKQPLREDVTMAHLTQTDCGKQPLREDVTMAHFTQTDCGKQPLREDVTMAHLTQTDCGKQPLREDVTMAHFTQTDCGKQPLREDVTMAHLTQTDCGKQPLREDVTLAHFTQTDCGKQPLREDVTMAHLTQTDCGKQPLREDVTMAHLTQTDCGKQPLREDVTMAHFTQTDCGKQPLREDVTLAHFTQTDCGKQPLREDVTLAHLTQPSFYYDLHKQKLPLLNVPKTCDVVSELQEAGYRASRTHFSATSVRTNANLIQIVTVLQEKQASQTLS